MQVSVGGLLNFAPLADSSVPCEPPRGGGQRWGGRQRGLTDADRTKLRNQARAWLEAELSAWTKLLDSSKSSERQVIAGTLQHWQQDSDLASVREPTALAKLPDDERQALEVVLVQSRCASGQSASSFED